MCQVVYENKKYLDEQVYNTQIAPNLRDLATNDQDNDVLYFAKMALYGNQDA